MKKIGYKLTDAQINYVIKQRNTGKSFVDIAKSFNINFARELDKNKTAENITSIYNRYENEDLSEDGVIQTLKTKVTTQKRNSQLAKENRLIVQNLIDTDTILASIKDAVNSIKLPKAKIEKVKVKKGLSGTTLEVLVSDVHYGKLSKDCNEKVIRARLQELTRTLLQEIEFNKKIYNIDEIVIALMGDIIESSTMHGPESLIGCQYTNPEQERVAIVSLFEDVIRPVAQLGYKVTVIGVTGNHDRVAENRTMNMAGKNNVTWTIYNTIKYICEQVQLNNVTFHIPEESFYIHKIYGENVLYEHGDNIKGLAESCFENQIAKRSQQAGVIISYIRSGHVHKVIMYGRGRVVVNASVCGQDSYAETLGYSSEPSQTINQFCQTKNRPSSFYKHFAVYLKTEKEKEFLK